MGWVVGEGWVVPREVGSSARRVRSRSPPLTPADGHHRCFWLRHRPRRAPCARRHRASNVIDRAACCVDAFLWLSSRAFCGPAGVRMCVVCCVTVCVTSVLITSTVDPSKRYTRSYHAGRLARSSVPAHRRAVRQEKSSMGSENCQRCSPRFRKSALMRSVPPRFDRAARKTRRALAAFLRL